MVVTIELTAVLPLPSRVRQIFAALGQCSVTSVAECGSVLDLVCFEGNKSLLLGPKSGVMARLSKLQVQQCL